ncbi:putative MerR family transcriptional regulator [Nocardia farcinica]|uniref:hypothetical protein n=1 Tax=Nocardia farcinica TaxID=37329 RepID=UPI000DFB43DB|nr:hypothetical protein [Nocardia farcinica]SUE31801.1 putative MerR family transcriptional regulator [Nocardia farcinica]
MLMLRRAELEQRIAADRARLAQIETRLRIIEREGVMPVEEVVIRSVPAVRVAELSEVAADFEPSSIGPVVGTLFYEPWQGLGRWIADNGYRTIGPSREVTLEYSEDSAKWVTELQEPIAPA